MRIVILLYLILSLHLACSKDDGGPTPAPQEQEGQLEVLWKRDIRNPQTLAGSISMNPIMHKGRVIINSEYNLGAGPGTVLFLDTADGSIVDSWSDYIDGVAIYTRETTAIDGDFLVLSQQGSINVINLTNGQTAWQSILSRNGPFIYTHEGILYTDLDFNGDRGSKIIQTPLSNLNWQTLYSFERTDGYDPGFDSMGFGELENGDKVVVWKNRSFTGSSERTDIFAYNLTADTLLWRNTDLNFNSGILPLQIDDNVVYGVVHEQAFAIDLNTGNTIWSRDFQGVVERPIGSNFDLGAMTIQGSRIILKGDGPELVTLNRRTGEVINVVNQIRGIRSKFSFYKQNLVYSTGQAILFVDPITGETLFSTEDDPRFNIIHCNILVDELGHKIYFHDGYYLYCARIPSSVQ